mmetsp:Transcript_99468/g.181432  ORF Transcript_99468/g.181432 Transcript_99468/m.181432 type:complete len:80 (-) Transcript_99468:151-390(-)
MTTPSRRQMIWSQSLTVDNLCAIINTLLPLSATNRSSAVCTIPSLSASRALVASSRIRMRGFTSMARATASRCFWPPDI